jgi:hypothetical protein
MSYCPEGRAQGRAPGALMPGHKTKAWAAILVIGGALLSLFFTLGQGSPRFNALPHEATGQVLADETVRLASGGGRITLVTLDTTVFKSPATAAVLKGFFQTLRKKGITLAATNLIRLDPLRAPRVPAGDFLEILRKQGERDVVISLLGPPLLSAEQKSRLGDKRPRVVAFCPGPMPRQVNLRELFEQQLLHMAIISRPVISLTPPQSAVPRAWFDYLYQVITLESVADLPPPLEAKAP